MAASNTNATYFDFYCQGDGAKWYACPKGSVSTFVGCCLEDPCAKGCAQGALRSVGFNISHYGEWPDGSCGQASNFYSCTAGDSFWGCCKSNPCAATPPATCPSDDLVPAFMDQDYQFSTFSSSGNATPSPSQKKNVGAIAGGVVGGLLGFLIIGALVFIFLRKKRRGQTQSAETVGAATVGPVYHEMDHGSPLTQFNGISPLPTYSAPLGPDQSLGLPTKHTYAHNGGVIDVPHDLPSHREGEFSKMATDAPESTSHRDISELSGTPNVNPANISPSQFQMSYANDMAKQPVQPLGLGLSMDEQPRKF